MPVASIVDTLLVVLTPHDTIARQFLAVGILLTAELLPPRRYFLEHSVAGLGDAISTHVSLSWMMQDTVDDAITETIYIGAVIINCIHDLGNSPTDHLSSGSTGDLIEDLIKTVTFFKNSKRRNDIKWTIIKILTLEK